MVNESQKFSKMNYIGDFFFPLCGYSLCDIDTWLTQTSMFAAEEPGEHLAAGVGWVHI